MRMTEFLALSQIRVPLEGRSKEEVIEELLDLVPLPGKEDRDKVYRAVMEREKLMSTGIGNGIAIPHGIVPLRIQLTAALGIAPAPIDFNAIDGQPVRLVFLLVGDEADPGKDIRALARIARLLHREEFRRSLMEARSPEEAMKTIEEEEKRHRI